MRSIKYLISFFGLFFGLITYINHVHAESVTNCLVVKDSQPKNCTGWKNTLACKESDYQYHKNASPTAFKGKYQMGCKSLKAIGCVKSNQTCESNIELNSSSAWTGRCDQVNSLQDFLGSPVAQENAMDRYSGLVLHQYVNNIFKGSPELRNLIGQEFECNSGSNTVGLNRPVKLDWSGVLTAAHLIGPTALKKCLKEKRLSGEGCFDNGKPKRMLACTYAELGKGFEVADCLPSPHKNGSKINTSGNKQENKESKTDDKPTNLYDKESSDKNDDSNTSLNDSFTNKNCPTGLIVDNVCLYQNKQQ
jgi:hypothetical protein